MDISGQEDYGDRIQHAYTKWLYDKDKMDLRSCVLILNDVLCFRDSMRNENKVDMGNFANVVEKVEIIIKKDCKTLWLQHLDFSLKDVSDKKMALTQEGFKSLVGQYLERIYYTTIEKLFDHYQQMIDFIGFGISRSYYPAMHIFNQMPCLKAMLMTELRQNSLAQLSYKRAIWRYYYPLVEERCGVSCDIQSETMVRNMIGHLKDEKYDQRKPIEKMLFGHTFGPRTEYQTHVLGLINLKDYHNAYDKLLLIADAQEQLDNSYALDQQGPFLITHECILAGNY